MTLETVKDATFRHCEKIVLAVVVVFVALKVNSYLGRERADEQVVPPPTAPPPPKVEPVDYVTPSLLPFVKVPEPAKAAHDPFWPQAVERRGPVVLQMGEETVAATCTLSSPLIGRLKLTPLDEWEQRYYGPQAGAIPGRPIPVDPRRAVDPRLTPQEPAEEPCRVTYTISPDRLTITFTAVAAGGYIALEGNLENKNKVRVLVKVLAKGVEELYQVLRAEEVTVKEEKIGHVVVRWVEQLRPPQPAPQPGEEEQQVTQWLPATYFNIYRKSEREEEKRLVGRVPGSGSGLAPRMPMMEERVPPEALEGMIDPRDRRVPYAPDMMRPPPARPRRPVDMGPPPGLPGAERLLEGARGVPPMGVEPVRPRPRGEREFEPAKAERQGEFLFTDNSVESETRYTYWVEAVLVDRNGAPIVEAMCCQDTEDSESKKCPGHEVETANKFSFAFIGIGSTGARIVVFIGRRQDPIDWRIFEVPLGAWVGELPGAAPVAPVANPVASGQPGMPPRGLAAGGQGGETHSYVTRHVLVDVQSQVLVPIVSETMHAVNGQMVPVKAYQYVPKHIAILRDAKNRFLMLPQESPSAVGVIERRERPGERMMTPEERMMMEGMMPPPRKGTRPKGGRPTYPRSAERRLEGG